MPIVVLFTGITFWLLSEVMRSGESYSYREDFVVFFGAFRAAGGSIDWYESVIESVSFYRTPVPPIVMVKFYGEFKTSSSFAASYVLL